METEKKVTLVIFTGKLKEEIFLNKLFLNVAANSEFYMEFIINVDDSFTPGYAKLINQNVKVELNTTELLTTFLQKIY